MKPIPVHRLPVLPNRDVLPKCPITTTGHITQDPIKQQLILLLRSDTGFRRSGEDDLLGGDLDSGVDGRVVVGDHERGRGKAGSLVDEHVRSVIVAVVRDEEAAGVGRSRDAVVGVECLEQLGRLRRGRGEHGG